MKGSEHARRSGPRSASRPRTPPAYRLCDGITEVLLYFGVVFAPWAFGATERWSIWTLNAAGYALGLALIAKWWMRWRRGYRPTRWGEDEVETQDLEIGDRAAQTAGGGKKLGTRNKEHGTVSGGPGP